MATKIEKKATGFMSKQNASSNVKVNREVSESNPSKKITAQSKTTKVAGIKHSLMIKL